MIHSKPQQDCSKVNSNRNEGCITQAAMDRLADATLKAEMMRYQRFTRWTRRIAQQLGEMREEYEQARELAHES